MKHVMVDIETLSTKPDAKILQIAAKVFDPHGRCHLRGAEFECNIDTDLSGGSTAPETLAFWLEQPDEVYDAVFLGGERESVVLARFASWIRPFCEGPHRIWARGTDFDLPILRSAFERVNIEIPWHFGGARDVRTACDFLPGNAPGRDYSKAHIAMEDVKHQIRCVWEVYRRES